MKILKAVVAIFAGITSFAHAQSSYENYVLTLQSGVTVNEQTVFNLARSDLTYADIRAEWKRSGVDANAGLLGYTNMGAGDTYYTLFSSMNLNAFNLATKQLLGSWPLSPYPEAIKVAGEARQAVTLAEYKAIPDPAVPTLDAHQYRIGNYTGGLDTRYGCLTQYPLRYGDLDHNGQQELVLALGEDWIIFSTTLNKVIFAASLHQDDELEASKIDEFMQHEGHTKGAATPQYLSYSAAAIELGKVAPAWRSFAKLYFGDFNNDNSFDIVMWRKFYESRPDGDALRGFALKGELLAHYTQVNGEYKRQPTDPAVIKGWLASKNLTWKKGYPNNSECAGQTNQLIPEFHDPLLNDPDVLQ